MYWRDIEGSTSADWKGLELVIRPPNQPAAPPTLHMQAGPKRTLRLMTGAWPLLWARVADDYYGYWYLRHGNASATPGLVVPPFSAVQGRGAGAEMFSPVHYSWWARLFGERLHQSPVSPFHPGRWWILPVKAAAGESGWGPWTQGQPQLPPFSHLASLPDQPASGYSDWDYNDDQSPLALRAMSARDDARVKAWRRAFREGTMPPVLALWVSGLFRYVVLDGHDRLVAALTEGSTPPVLALFSVQETPRISDPTRRQAIAQEVAAQLAAAKKPEVRPDRAFRVETANRLLIDAYDDRPHLSFISRGWPLEGGLRSWARQVRDALPTSRTDVDDVRDGLLAGLDDDHLH